MFQAMFVNFARRLNALHGYGGYGLVLSAVREERNQPFEAYLARLLNGLDVGKPRGAHAHQGIKTVSWLTAVNHAMVEKVGGLHTIQSELPADWFALYEYGEGVIVQAGPKPEAAPTDQPKPARLVLPNRLFKPIRAPCIGIHYGSVNGEYRLNSAEGIAQWLQRFDIEEGEVDAYKNQLLDEPKLTESTVLQKFATASGRKFTPDGCATG
jgi:hypothetical protein